MAWEVRTRRQADRWLLAVGIPLRESAVTCFTVIRNRLAGAMSEVSGFPDGGAYFDTAQYVPIE